MLHYTAYVCLSDIDVKQTYSQFHTDSDTILGKDGIMSAFIRLWQSSLRPSETEQSYFSFTILFGDIHERNR